MKLVIQPYPVDKQTLHRHVLSSLFLVKTVSSPHWCLLFSVLPPLRDTSHTEAEKAVTAVSTPGS